jgi:hypothetical protein
MIEIDCIKQNRFDVNQYKRNIKFTLLFLLILPSFLFGQQLRNRVDSIYRGGLGDTTLRPIYFVVDELPTLSNAEEIQMYLMKQSLVTDEFPCCAFRA